MAQFLSRLPNELEDAEAIVKRREKAAQRKDNWRSLYSDCYKYAMPMRDTFDWNAPGQFKNNILYDSTLQDVTYEAANTMVALLMPAWQRWCSLIPGKLVLTSRQVNLKRIITQLQEITETFFGFLNQSNFASVSNEVALDLLVGTAALRFDENIDDDSNPFNFSATPLAALEIEEGPAGTIETVFMLRKPLARNLVRMYAGMDEFDLPAGVQERIHEKPDEEIEIIQCTIYHPETRHYYGVVVSVKDKAILWRYDFGESSPDIVGRAFKVAGESYGRGRITLALSDARTLDKMQEFILRHSAIQIAPPVTGVSDGVLNPYTAVLMPNTVLPVGSNDSRNPSLKPIEIGGNFQISEAIMTDLRERIRRTMLGPEPSDGPVKSATEISISDRNRLWALGGEYGRIQAELLTKIVARGVYILQARGLIPRFRIDGREVGLAFESPFARSQDAEDLLAFDNTVQRMMAFEGMAAVALNVDKLSEWIPRKAGMDMTQVNDQNERQSAREQAAQATAQLAKMAQDQGQKIA